MISLIGRADLDYAAGTVIDAIAELHVRFWETDALASSRWLPPADNPLYLQAEAQYQEHFPAFIERYGDGRTPSAMAVAEDLQTRINELQHLAAEERPQTLAHFDLRLDNLMFSDDAVYLLDWQLSIQSIGAADVAYYECEDHVRRSMLGVATIAAYGSVAVPATNERGQRLLDAMVDRVFSAVDDLNSGELFPS